ncbi:MAG: hypothetical protein ACK55O_08035, partial [Phycisphaerales bacterium]
MARIHQPRERGLGVLHGLELPARLDQFPPADTAAPAADDVEQLPSITVVIALGETQVSPLGLAAEPVRQPDAPSHRLGVDNIGDSAFASGNSAEVDDEGEAGGGALDLGH